VDPRISRVFSELVVPVSRLRSVFSARRSAATRYA